MHHYAQNGNAADAGRAASGSLTSCYLCFQALEANRPIAGGAKLACG